MLSLQLIDRDLLFLKMRIKLAKELLITNKFLRQTLFRQFRHHLYIYND